MKTVKRIIGGVGALLLLGVLALAGMLASAFWGNAPLPETADLPGGARLVKDGMVAFFVLPAGGASVALVDCGNDPSAAKVLAELARRNLRREDVKAIFLTHGHADHTGGCHQFPAADVMALAPDVGLADGSGRAHGPLTRFMKNGPDKAVKVTRVLADGETVQVGPLAVRAFAVPGHTAGSAAFLAGGVLYLGDSATDRADGSLAGAPWPFTDSAAQNRASLRALWTRLKAEGLEVRALAPSHSAPKEGTASLETFAASRE